MEKPGRCGYLMVHSIARQKSNVFVTFFHIVTQTTTVRQIFTVYTRRIRLTKIIKSQL